MTQQRSYFFLDMDDDVRLTQIFGQTCVLAAQLLVLLIHRMALGLRPAPLRSQRFEDAVGPLTPPSGQRRRVQTFPAEEADTASCGSGGLGFLQDAQLPIPRCRYAAWARDHFGIRPRGQHRIGAAGLPLHSASARQARLRSVPWQPNLQKKQNQENSRSSLPFSFSPCSLIKSTKTVSRMLARRVISAAGCAGVVNYL